jgi:hypothetical protein
MEVDTEVDTAAATAEVMVEATEVDTGAAMVGAMAAGTVDMAWGDTVATGALAP